MRMGDRRLKHLDRLGNRVQTKTALHDKPVNRAERRRFAHILKQAHVDESEIDQGALFEAIRARRGT